MAAVNGLRSGNMLVDMLIALIVPMLFSFMTDGRARNALQRVCHRLSAFFPRLLGSSADECVRTITHTRFTNNPCQVMGDQKNDAIQKALVLYWSAHGVSYRKKAQVSLTCTS